LNVEVSLLVLRCFELGRAGGVILLWTAINADKLVLISTLDSTRLVLFQEKFGIWSDGNFSEAA
jgi:hypothetical protein